MQITISSEADLVRHRRVLADLVREQWNPGVFNFHENERWKMAFDLETHLAFLGEAVRCGMPQLFSEYAVWTHLLLTTSGGDAAQFRECLAALDRQIEFSGTGEWVALARKYLAEAAEQLDQGQPVTTSYLVDDNPHKTLAESFLEDCLSLKRGQATAKIHAAVAGGVSVSEIYLNVITPVLHELGRLWHLNHITVADEHYCTAVSQMVMAQLFPAIFDGSPRQGRMVSTCVAGELHEVGARMVSDLFEMNGWDTIFLGADASKDTVINTLVEHGAQVLAVSVTLVLLCQISSTLSD
jgi:methanogenic corrinoid protein MtbC1